MLSLLFLAPLLLASCSNSSKEEYIEWLESSDSNIINPRLYFTSYYDATLDKYMIAMYYGSSGNVKEIMAGTDATASEFVYAVGPQKSKDKFAIDFTSENAKYYLNYSNTKNNFLIQAPNPSSVSKQTLDLYSTLPAAVLKQVLTEYFNKYEVTFTKRSFDENKSYEVNKNKRENEFSEQTWTIKCEDTTYVTRSSGIICSKTAQKESIYTSSGNTATFLDGLAKDSTVDDATDLINKRLNNYLKTEEDNGVVNVWANN